MKFEKEVFTNKKYRKLWHITWIILLVYIPITYIHVHIADIEESFLYNLIFWWTVTLVFIVTGTYFGLKYNIKQDKLIEKKRAEIEEKLVHTEKMAAIGQLAGGVAHNVNNIMGGIIGYLDLLRNKVPHECKRYVDFAISNSERATGLATNLLSFARKGKLIVSRFSAHNSLKDLEGLLNSMMSPDIIRVFNLKAKKFFIKADVSEFQNTILNIMINAKDAIGDSGGIITVSTFNKNEFLLIEIADTGCGMDKKTQSHVFEPFYTTKDIGKGTGLGLSGAYGCVKGCGGKILIKSLIGKGTTFSLYFPISKEI